MRAPLRLIHFGTLRNSGGCFDILLLLFLTNVYQHVVDNALWMLIFPFCYLFNKFCAGCLLLSVFRKPKSSYFRFYINSFHLTLSQWDQQCLSTLPQLVSLELFFFFSFSSLIPSSLSCTPASRIPGKVGCGQNKMQDCMYLLSLSNPLTINLLPKPETAWYYMKSPLFVTLFKTTGRGQGYLIPYSSQVHYWMQIVGMKNGGEMCRRWALSVFVYTFQPLTEKWREIEQ